MFGNEKSLPCRFYSYGARPPIEGLELVVAQMELARRYRNAHVQIEWRRRNKVEVALLALSPALDELETVIEATKYACEQARGVINRASSMARTKVYPPGAAEAAAAAVKKLEWLYEKRKAIRKEIFESPTWRPIKKKKEKPIKGRKQVRKKKSAEEKKAILETVGGKIDAWAEAQCKRLYAVGGRMGLYWGTRNYVATTVNRSGAPPQLSHKDGDGHLFVQIQHGMSPEEAFAGEDNRIQIEPLQVQAPPDLIGPRLSKARMTRTRVRFRVGSDASGGPIFALIPIVLHRDLPGDTQIKGVHLTRTRIATHCEWRVEFMLARAAGWGKPDRAVDGTVSIDVGWRVTTDDGRTPRPDGDMRVAYWKGSGAKKDLELPPYEKTFMKLFSTDGSEGELVLPARWMAGMRKVRDLQSIRDKKCFNPARDRLSTWLKEAKNVPGWLVERTATLPYWRSIARLASLVLRWRFNRFDGDLEIFNTMEAWRKRDKHLYEYEENLRSQLQRWREDIYGKFVARIRRINRVAKIEKLDLRDFHELPEAEEDVRDGALKEHVRDACLSFLFQRIGESYGRETVKVSAVNTTATCHVCGALQEWNHKILRHTCTVCGAEWDQDDNASANISEREGIASVPVA